MLFAPQSSLFFPYVIITIGLLTSLTDLQQRKIYNIHLILGTGLGLIAAWLTFLSNPEIIVSHLAGGGLAFLVGWLLYHFKLWRGGDAKLFALYAFLMPPLTPSPVFSHIPFSHVVTLFACSFIIAMIIIMPIFIKDIILNYRAIADDILAKRNSIVQGLVTSMFFSWVMFPLFYLAKATSPVFILTTSYLLYVWGYDADEKEARKHSILDPFREKRLELCIGIPLGFLLRLWVVPDSLSWPILIRSILTIGIWAIISSCLYTVINHLKEYRDRVPFAPLLFLGCVLSYTPFLTWITHLTRR